MRLCIVVLFAAACSSSSPPPAPQPSPPSTAAGAPSSLPAHSALSVGAQVPMGRAVAVGDVLAKPDDYAGKTVIVEGKVRAACSRKGCWMELASSTSKEAPGCRVRFKDYGFFVPTDSAGADARLSGEVKVRTIPKDEVDHLVGEGATLARAADGSARAVEITATGVELMRM